jgi:hypothetical protein
MEILIIEHSVVLSLDFLRLNTPRQGGKLGEEEKFHLSCLLPMERNFYPEMEAEAVIRLVRETARIHSL